MMLRVTANPPPVAVIVTVRLARGAVEAAFNISEVDARPPLPAGMTGLALQVADTPVGRPLMAKLTAV